MIVLSVKTDQPLAEAGLYEDSTQTAYKSWQGHRQLSATIHKNIKQLLDEANLAWDDIEVIIFFAGPGSFTGLRIGASLAGGLANGLSVPIVSSKGSGWIKTGLTRLKKGENDKAARPYYGAQPNTTKPKK